jgi:thiol-disulfide isomerase/thioredoxin
LQKIIAVLFIHCLLGLSVAHAIEVGEQLPLGNLKTIEGQVLPESEWSKRNTLVQVWATWCSYCKKQNAHLHKLLKTLSPGSLNVVTLSVDKKSNLVLAYMKENAYDFPVVMMTPELSNLIGKRRGIPELYILDRSGKVIQKDYGLMVDLDFYDLSRYSNNKK